MTVAIRLFNFWKRLMRVSAAAFLGAFCFQVLVLAGFSGAAFAGERRVAFVVGNSNYSSVPQLPNPRNDAEGVAAALKKSGFEVILAVDLDRRNFDTAMEKFVRSMDGADLSVFYYSGHGLQVGGDNRIVPIDAQLKSPSDLEVETVSVKTIMSYMRSNSKVQLVFLDSCRNNPFPSKAYLVGPERQVEVAGVGLAPQETLVGSLAAFATQPGAVAIDGSGANSPFTQSVLASSFKIGVDVKSALEKVTEDVWQATSQKQKPWTSEALAQPVYLSRPVIRIAPVDQVAAGKAPSVKVAAAPSQDSNTTSAAAAPQNQIAIILQDILSKPQRVPIGVGQVAMLDNFPIIRAASTAQVEIRDVPKAGVLYFDGKPLGEGDIIDLESLHKVTYEPAVDTNDKVQDLSLKVSEANGGTTEVSGKLEPFVVSCDAEAGEPLDLQGVGLGKLPNEINPDTAIPACTDAVQKYPDVARYKYELGRAKLAAKDTVGALDFFKQAAEAGHVRASNQLGYMAEGGFGRPLDVAEANKLFKAAADKGDPYGMLSYGRNLVLGRGVTKDVQQGTRLLKKSVEMGHTYAMNELGSMYYYGRGVKVNPERGLRFYQAALERDDIYAMRNFGIACLQGKGVQQDWQKALALFKKASDGGHPNAPTDIGAMYFNGNGVPKDMASAANWYQIGADRGDPWAASNLAYIYSHGPANLIDADKAVKFASLAVALDRYNENPKNKDVLKALPASAKQKMIKELISEVGAADAKTGVDLDETLVLLSQQAWHIRNPRLDLF